ncbi:hypothetical protein ICN48_05615 [Polynucleobacter sp. JS-Safj-400b-B2]|uniref:hypothetical protein n=1 Tax=Polynucleobacter sp. JS-Safj-400b-B2 TaxID=2576921 RepID=UPI001C0D0262|nr:hypothetical protein [Polynucleobacter sp. JS-Safj-400b-B2]MBU3625711.1 hypothetical protein [Polynucleobacter sp. JS-Safj-400b-B2]
MSQIALPTPVTPEQVSIQRSLGESISLCLRVAGYDIDKTPAGDLGIDKAQFSRWKSNQEGIKWEKLTDLMDRCGNDAPLLWMLHARGYDLTSLRQRETELQRENRILRDQLAAARLLLGFK